MADVSTTGNASSRGNKLTAQPRDSFGKGAARRLRASGRIPAVIYGHGTDPQHVSLPGHEVALILRKANQVLDLDIAGASQLALVKDVQKDPVRQVIEHLDLIVVRRGEKVTVDVPIHVEGESAPGTIIELDNQTISVEVEATHIPERFLVDAEGLEEGTQVLAGQIEIGSGATLVTDPEALVVNVTVPPVVDLPEPTEGDEPEGAESAEAEGSADSSDAE
ncbi:MAG: 50S ribosomal protein L25/general stress protein Ctc [Micrococcales bacterium]|nr:50S ribosomal protein L25/general stress protein Ctc [Micrococcales bacterium]